MSCEYRNTYIQVFELFRSYSGDLGVFHKKSPVQKIVNFYVRISEQKKELLKRGSNRKEIKLKKASFDIEKPKNIQVTINKYGEDMEKVFDINAYLAARKLLLSELSLVQEIIKREKIKAELIMDN